ncbi:MAG TPA: HAMP domain-containing sensor histidine kinase [Acidimicrobiales bacterium]|nr:HAMP domain-containing sensor histidine kinase [Acidimicrobiales bacterium]
MSLRLRLLLAVGAIATVALVVADLATYSALQSFLYKQVDQSLAQHPARLAANPVTGGPDCPSPHSAAFGAGDGSPGGGGGANFPNTYGIGYIAVTTTSGSVVAGLECPAYVGNRAYRPQLPGHITGFTIQSDGTSATYFTAGPTKPGGPQFRVLATQLQNGDLIIQAFSLGDTTRTLHTLFLIELAVTAGALVLALAGGWWLVRLGLRPLGDVERTADSIAAGNLDQRVPGADDTSEVGRLARALNVMLERIETAFSARLASEARLQESERHLRQFVADASHELRTPIAAVSAYAELFERGAGQRADDLPRVMTGIRTETARMDRLVSDLLTLARLDEGLPLEFIPVELVALGAEAVRTSMTVGPAWPVQFTASRPVEVMGDPVRLRQVLDNLLANVRAHTPEGTTATVHVDQEGPRARIAVSDTGPGMPADEAARVFERFYRFDAARARTHGGSGLGLSIVAAIVHAHGGTVAATSSRGGGMTVTVSIPISAPLGDPAVPYDVR